MSKFGRNHVAIFLGGAVFGLATAFGVWRLSTGERIELPTPAFEPKARVAAKFHEVMTDFCKRDYTQASIFARYAPGGATRQGQGQVPPSPTAATYVETESVVSLVTTDAATRVIWWLKPWRGDVIPEIHVVPDVSARIVPYAEFVEEFRLGPSRKLSQSAALADIPHVHQISCGEKQIRATLQEIVWAGEFIGKMGEMTLTKGDPETPYQRQVLSDP